MTSLGQARQAGRQTDMQTDRQQQQGECSATTPKSLECRFSQILYAESWQRVQKLKTETETVPELETEPRTITRTETKQKAKRNVTKRISLN